jgi:glutamine synthetase
MPAAILAAGLDGINAKRDPGKRLDINMYTEGHLAGEVKRLPLNLLDALRALQASKLLNESLGEYVPAYLKLKHQEWDDFSRHLTDWERDATLDC